MADNSLAYVTKFKSKTQKTDNQKRLINEALDILCKLGIPLKDGIPQKERTPRRLECMGMAFLAVANVTKCGDWKAASNANRFRSKDIIEFVNQHFGESISSGSYDDIRRKDLKYAVKAGIVDCTQPEADPNNPTNGYVMNPDYLQVVKSYGKPEWTKKLESILKRKGTVAEKLKGSRSVLKEPLAIPDAIAELGSGPHNDLQRAILLEFLPRFGFGAKPLYFGDATVRLRYRNTETLRKINFFKVDRGKLPDIVAYSSIKNWVYIIEAVYKTGPMDRTRVLDLKKKLKECTAQPIFVTAFIDRSSFRQKVADIAWETEVWIASDPDHLIHFDGEKFLGPYAKD